MTDQISGKTAGFATFLPSLKLRRPNIASDSKHIPRVTGDSPVH
jgi:hypothetical protein